MTVAVPPLQRKHLFWATVPILTSAVALMWPQKVTATLHFVVQSFMDVALLIALGLVISAWAAASGAATVTARWFKGRPVATILMASGIGSVIPVCGVTVLPLTTGLLASGVPLAPIMAFWVSSPITGPTMLAVTWALLGPGFAIGKLVAAFALGVFSGAITALLARTQMVQHPLRSQKSMSGLCDTCTPAGLSFRIWRDRARMRAFGTNLVSTTRTVVLCLTFAFSAEFLLRDFLPSDALAAYVGVNSSYAIPLAVLVGAPMYLDGLAALPLVQGLLDLGMSPGAAMALLVSGGAVSIWGVMAVALVLRPSTIALFVALAVSGSLVIGYVFQALWTLLS
ncbi:MULTISPECIES: permease [unclassified Mesorhizobium]|nr:MULTISPECIES: permease [unclassified Mesorhizobium]TGS72171.1 permease [Mesorhizobium sp. M3A.F.Ca.ET.201.01.1.1]TGS87844.1 permease [Mesorhizobium sp. M3A.F.Ca.ET.175.01.1.1]TGT28303.1 permease [Mesorhizobium sp. M3A.F.Ca.ET.174.01.1.1]TGT61049.1 permease [Mesorhizobium sp. M00.F.Ca.ET.170.01.1.1]AZO08818.1 permease [Mesorhizobium sp. M3A.F.Ca.ET.080.04.2.1]